MYRQLYIIIFTLIASAAFSQNCGTVISDEHLKSLNTYILKYQSCKANFRSPIEIPVQHIIIREDNGTTSHSDNEIDNAMIDANNTFSSLGISFFECAPKIYYNDGFFSWNLGDINDDTLVMATMREDVLNVYWVESLGGNAGLASFPGWLLGSQLHMDEVGASGGFAASVGGDHTDITAADIDNDGDLDIITTKNSKDTISVFENFTSPNGVFYPKDFTSINFETGNGPKELISEDFNNDGHMDIAVANYNDNSVSILMGQNNIAFDAKVDFPVIYHPTYLSTGYLNNDQNMDIIVASSSSSSNGISIMLGDGTGNFQVSTINQAFTSNFYINDVLLADLNHDKKLDILGAYSFGSTYKLFRFTGKGDGTFNTAETFNISGKINSIAVADIDKDNNIDIVSTHPYNNEISIFMGSNNSPAGTATYLSMGNEPRDLDLKDINADGVIDIIVLSKDSIVTRKGNGDGTFQSFYKSCNRIYDDSKMIVEDMDNDNQYDIAITSNYDIYIENIGYGHVSRVRVLKGENDGYFRHQEQDRILMATTDEETLIHEFGHYLSLPHTHETAWGDELVNGSNCSTHGDRICDTPADPNSWNQTLGCNYAGSLTDANGDPYQPLSDNLMSYNRYLFLKCRDSFTPDQKSQMVSCANLDRAYLCCWPNYTLSLSNTYSTQETQTAKFEIDADNIIQSGANVDYKSGKEITLKPGFHAQNGSDFNARIIDCGE